jgi:hypothetical protein
MIRSINSSLDKKELLVYIEELESREEFACSGDACAAEANVCLRQACALACIGITACAVGLHIW